MWSSSSQHTSAWLGVAAAALVGSCASTRLRAAEPSADLLDYLIQDVCVDAGGKVTAQDPAVCARHRNARVGEPSPYILTDQDRRTGATFQGVTSLPVRGSDGALLVLAAKSLRGGFNGDFTFGFDPRRDGYDLIDASRSGFASVIRTHDPGCHDQLIAQTAHPRSARDRVGGWVLFPTSTPTSWPPSSSREVTTYLIRLEPDGAACTDGHATGLTTWRRPQTYRFESDRALLAIRSDHFAAVDLGASENVMERFYFSREYGLTRWESWWPRSACVAQHSGGDPACRPGDAGNLLAGRCDRPLSPTDRSPGLEIIGGQAWVRRDCRDQTHFIPLRRPQRMLAPGMGDSHGVKDLGR